ncbi:MAG: hypothetical protein IJS10_01745 [Alphaproteobacteria bacterium]|nr:hypothetical protein [Alphaproteobacteria bacterium]
MRHVAVIFAFIQCCCADTIIETEAQFYHFMYESGWRAHASEVVNNPSRNEWYNEEIYKYYIYKVIPQAIAVTYSPIRLDLDGSLLNANKINAFKNYINVPGQIEKHKCYMTATLTAL